ncbi:putative 3-methyladenine DNA glycosylase [Frondihabitans sucicola]|uniref:Putative 3-methyladenine DNA glycosylase n=1 Tax=Frondihabitans sucicola TaxID=1268041 RepID=A0ABN6XZ49_9MICO|nr:DNA-3-methyladenine glycosylase [Frondihabitans sucicola]BDZ50201.1 putative 3-methyladenine DNA glycosylase [Frondihabitans sucicola]
MTVTSPLDRPVLEAAPLLLGAVFRSGEVAVRITEVEAYQGQGQDAGSHAHRGRTARNNSLWGPPGTLYVYLSYGIHRCLNLVCGPEGTASGILLRGGEVVDGLETARARRPTARRDVELARGPGRLGTALGVELTDDGSSIETPPFSLTFPIARPGRITTSPRVGVSGHAGTDAYPWRFFLDGEPTVSAYRAAALRRPR